MALSDDQRAMLRLLAQREQGYEDIAALMGLSVDEVRTKVKAALAQLEDEGVAPPPLPDEPAPPPPEPPAPAPSPPPPAAEPPAPAAEPAPAAATPVTPAAPAAKKGEPRKLTLTLPSGNGARAAIVASLAAVVVVVLILALGGGSDGGDGTTASDASVATEATTTGDEGETVEAANRATKAELTAVDGGDASGSAEFGRVQEALGLGISAEGLEPDVKGRTYMVWLAEPGREKMLPLTALQVPASGEVKASYQVPTEAVIYMASGDFDHLVLTRADSATLRKALVAANKQKAFPAYTGDPVLEGEIVGPIIGAQARLEARQKEKEGK
jgi:hypothetical protein